MEQIAPFPVPLVVNDIVQERISDPDAEQGVRVPVPQMVEDIVEADRLVPRKRSRPRVVEQRVSILLLRSEVLHRCRQNTKKATRRNKQGDGVDDGDDDAMLDEARKLLEVQLAELKAVWKEGDPFI